MIGCIARKAACLGVTAVAGLVLAAPYAVAKDAIADFYKGKQITIFIGFAAGGGYDAYARLLAQHMGKYLPGAPSFVVKNMFGAAGEVAAAYVANVAPKDGTAIAGVAASQPLARIFQSGKKQTYDPGKQHYLGSASSDTFVCMVTKNAPVKTAKEIFSKELILGTGARRSGTLTVIPQMEKNLLGTKIKLIVGYKGSRAIVAAMEKGELHGLCGMNLSSLNSRYAHHLRSGMARILLQQSVEGDAGLNAAKVPLMYNFAKTEKQKKIMRTIYAQSKFARPYFVANGVPAERVAALQKAFLATWADKALLAAAKKRRLRVAPIPGSQIQAIAADLARQPESFIKEVKASINFN